MKFVWNFTLLTSRTKEISSGITFSWHLWMSLIWFSKRRKKIQSKFLWNCHSLRLGSRRILLGLYSLYTQTITGLIFNKERTVPKRNSYEIPLSRLSEKPRGNFSRIVLSRSRYYWFDFRHDENKIERIFLWNFTLLTILESKRILLCSILLTSRIKENVSGIPISWHLEMSLIWFSTKGNKM